MAGTCPRSASLLGYLQKERQHLMHAEYPRSNAALLSHEQWPSTPFIDWRLERDGFSISPSSDAPDAAGVFDYGALNDDPCSLIVKGAGIMENFNVLASFQLTHLNMSPNPSNGIPTCATPAVKLEEDAAFILGSNFSPADSTQQPPSNPQRCQQRPCVKRVAANHSKEQNAVLKRVKPPSQVRRVRAAVPDGATSLEQSLLTKSNYENILDGTTTDTYSDDFSEKVLSKRVAHKLCEKARRDRLTSAIRKMRRILPDGFSKDCHSTRHQTADIGESSSASNSPVSKIVVVESAIRYIQQLENDIHQMTRRSEEAEQLLDVDVRLGSNEESELASGGRDYTREHL